MRSVSHLAVLEGDPLLEPRAAGPIEALVQENPVVGETREQIAGGEHPQDVIACRPQPVSGETVGPHPVRAPSTPQDYGPGCDSLDPEALEVADPVVDAAAYAAGS